MKRTYVDLASHLPPVSDKSLICHLRADQLRLRDEAVALTRALYVLRGQLHAWRLAAVILGLFLVALIAAVGW